MLIQIAGSNGSGKSWTVRSFMKAVIDVKGTKLAKKEGDKVIGYELNLKGWKRPVFVIGPYDVPTGGCDTRKSAITVFDDLPGLHAQYDVVFEGAMIMNHERGKKLAAEFGKQYCVVRLMTNVGQCLKNIRKRRTERGAGELPKIDNIRQNHQRAEMFASKLGDTGAQVYHLSADAAPLKIMDLLGEPCHV